MKLLFPTVLATSVYSLEFSDSRLSHVTRLINKFDTEAKNYQANHPELAVSATKKLGDADDTENLDTINPRANPQGRFLAKKDLVKLQDYGCWCYFEEEKGKGKPVDVFDQACKTLQDGYECIRIDAENNNLQCDIWSTEYNSSTGAGGLDGMTMQQLQKECDAANGENTCESWICRVEGWFIQNIVLAYFRDFQQPDAKFNRGNGFNPDAMCEIKPGPASEKACCGEYPTRFPFKTQGGLRGCCQSRTYNSDMHQCCKDGTVKPVCDL